MRKGFNLENGHPNWESSFAYGFTSRNWKAGLIRFPQEDSFNINSRLGIFAVADGVTEDCTNGKVANKNPSGAWDIFWHYPRPSHAKKAADIFAGHFSLGLISSLHPDTKDIFNSFREANDRIRKDNLSYGRTYPPSDYTTGYPSGCTAAGVVESESTFSWGYLADCGVAVVDVNGNLRDKTKDEGPGKMGDYHVEREKIGGWKSKEGRELTRKKFRNNPSEPRACGILNGMPEAMDYVRTGVFEKRSEDYLLVYSDGIAEVIFDRGDIRGKVADLLRKKEIGKLELFCGKKVRTEGTLVIKR